MAGSDIFKFYEAAIKHAVLSIMEFLRGFLNHNIVPLSKHNVLILMHIFKKTEINNKKIIFITDFFIICKMIQGNDLLMENAKNSKKKTSSGKIYKSLWLFYRQINTS